jgi:hypothetical protein
VRACAPQQLPAGARNKFVEVTTSVINGQAMSRVNTCTPLWCWSLAGDQLEKLQTDSAYATRVAATDRLQSVTKALSTHDDNLMPCKYNTIMPTTTQVHRKQQNHQATHLAAQPATSAPVKPSSTEKTRLTSVGHIQQAATLIAGRGVPNSHPVNPPAIIALRGV